MVVVNITDPEVELEECRQIVTQINRDKSDVSNYLSGIELYIEVLEDEGSVPLGIDPENVSPSDFDKNKEVYSDVLQTLTHIRNRIGLEDIDELNNIRIIIKYILGDGDIEEAEKARSELSSMTNFYLKLSIEKKEIVQYDFV
jgi:hypothetical protein